MLRFQSFIKVKFWVFEDFWEHSRKLVPYEKVFVYILKIFTHLMEDLRYDSSAVLKDF